MQGFRRGQNAKMKTELSEKGSHPRERIGNGLEELWDYRKLQKKRQEKRVGRGAIDQSDLKIAGLHLPRVVR